MGKQHKIHWVFIVFMVIFILFAIIIKQYRIALEIVTILIITPVFIKIFIKKQN